VNDCERLVEQHYYSRFAQLATEVQISAAGSPIEALGETAHALPHIAAHRADGGEEPIDLAAVPKIRPTNPRVLVARGQVGVRVIESVEADHRISRAFAAVAPHLGQRVGRHLYVCIDEQQHLPARRLGTVIACGETPGRRGVAQQHVDALGGENGRGIVAGAVVDGHDLEITQRRSPQRGQAARQRLGSVENRQHHRERARSRHLPVAHLATSCRLDSSTRHLCRKRAAAKSRTLPWPVRLRSSSYL